MLISRTLILLRFLIVFNNFGSIWGGFGASKNYQKSQKIDFGARSERGLACDMILVAISKRFLQILMDFGRIRMVFWKGLGVQAKERAVPKLATKSFNRSMDGLMEGFGS